MTQDQLRRLRELCADWLRKAEMRDWPAPAEHAIQLSSLIDQFEREAEACDCEGHLSIEHTPRNCKSIWSSLKPEGAK